MTARQKKPCAHTAPKLYSPADLSKKWFIYWHTATGRVRVYGQLNSIPTQAERMAAAQRMLAEITATLEMAPRSVSEFERKITRWMDEQRHRWRPKTQQQYQSIADTLLAWLAGRAPTLDLIADFLQHIARTRHATTFNKYRSKVGMILKAIRHSQLMPTVAPMRAQSTPARYFQKFQAQRLGAWMQEHDPQLWRFCQFIHYTFIRPNELRHLRVGDILFDEAQIRIPAHISKNGATQYVVIPDVFLQAVQHYQAYAPNDYLFPSPTDASKPITVNSMYMRHRRALRDLNFGTGYTLYGWKHTGAVAAAKAGASLKELQIQLRHHSLDMTDRYLRGMGVRDVVQLRRIFPDVLAPGVALQ